MIELFSGTPGSGKSLHTAAVIDKWISRFGAPVIGNFAFKASAIKARKWGSYLEVNNSQLDPEFLIYFSDEYKRQRNWKSIPEEHILLVIDECQILFNAREFNKPNRMAWISFFTQHRKLGYRVILIAQFDRMIDRQIRSVIEYEWIHRKVKNIGTMGALANFFVMGGLHVCVQIYKPLSEKVGSEWFRGNKYLYSLYDSYNRFSADVPG